MVPEAVPALTSCKPLAAIIAPLATPPRITWRAATPLTTVAKAAPPDETSWVPSVWIVVALAMPSATTCMPPPLITAPKSAPALITSLP